MVFILRMTNVTTPAIMDLVSESSLCICMIVHGSLQQTEILLEPSQLSKVHIPGIPKDLRFEQSFQVFHSHHDLRDKKYKVEDAEILRIFSSPILSSWNMAFSTHSSQITTSESLQIR